MRDFRLLLFSLALLICLLPLSSAEADGDPIFRSNAPVITKRLPTFDNVIVRQNQSQMKIVRRSHQDAGSRILWNVARSERVIRTKIRMYAELVARRLPV